MNAEAKGWDAIYRELEEFAHQVRLQAVTGDAPLYYTFSDSNIQPPVTNNLDAVLRRLVVVIDYLKEDEKLSAYAEGLAEGKESAFDDGYRAGYDDGVYNRGYDNDEAYDRSIGN